MDPYREAPKVLPKGQRTFLGRLRSWRRRRLIEEHGTFRQRHPRVHICPGCNGFHRAPKRENVPVGPVQEYEIAWAIPTVTWECGYEEKLPRVLLDTWGFA